MSKQTDNKQIYIQTFDFAGKNVTLEDTEALSDDEEHDHFIEFKAQETNKIPEINVSEEDGETERGQWGNKLDFLFSCISVSVGLGNVSHYIYIRYVYNISYIHYIYISYYHIFPVRCGGSLTCATKMEEVN